MPKGCLPPQEVAANAKQVAADEQPLPFGMQQVDTADAATQTKKGATSLKRWIEVTNWGGRANSSE